MMSLRLLLQIPALAVWALMLLTTACRAQVPVGPLESITEAELRDHIHYLASDFLAGRKTGEMGYTLAAQYGAIQLGAAGLRSMYTDSAGAPSFFQPIAFERAKVSDASALQVKAGGEAKDYSLGEKFVAFPLASAAELNREDIPVFLGYGIEEPEHGWNDYEGVDVSGRIAVIVGGAPARDGEPVLPAERHAIYSSLPRSANARVISALDHGASALIIVIDSASASLWNEVAARMAQPSVRPRPLTSPERGGSRSGLWIIMIRADDAVDLLTGSGYDPVTGNGLYTPGPLNHARIALDLTYEVEHAFSAPNVVALLPGSDPLLRDEYIAVTAHLDHLGTRDGRVYNGADDNASGSAALLEAAEAAAMVPVKRSIMFVLFAAEEEGLLGSEYFADDPPVPIENIVLSINLDMVGRNSPDWPESLLAMGSENRRPELLQLIREVNASVRADLDWRLNEGDDPHVHVQRSDQLAFIRKGVPAILITRGFMGPDYHRASDDPGTINYPKVTQASKLACALAVEAGNREVLFEED